MDIQKAREILDSLGVIEVTYNNIPVWINQIDGDKAQVQNLETHEKFEVLVYHLKALP
jgi:small acid-soluble spore protein H (minor)